MVRKPAVRPLIHHTTSLGVAAAITGVALGFVAVYFNDFRDPQLAVYAQGSGSCQQQEQACASKNGHGACHSAWVQCITKKCVGTAGAAGQCNKDPECQASCTESATSQGGKLSCCDGGPQHGNTCRDKVDGKCNPKATELGKEKGAGGEMPKMPELPKGGGGGGGGGEPPPTTPTEEECKKEPKPAGCPAAGVSNSLLDSFKDIFSTDTTAKDGEDKSVTTKLMEFISGGSSEPAPSNPTPAINNPTEAQVTPVVVSGANAGQLTSSQGNASGQTNSGATGNSGQNSAVTGFGGGAQAQADATNGPIVLAMQNVIGKIRNLLSSWF